MMLRTHGRVVANQSAAELATGSGQWGREAVV